MSRKARPPRFREHRLLSHLLDDIARLPIVSSRAEWLPLLRQIQRGVQLSALRGEDDAETLRHLQRKLHQEISELNGYCRSQRRQALDVPQFARELDNLFIDANFTPALPVLPSPYSPHHRRDGLAQEHEDRAWTIAYLLTLLPLEYRGDYLTAVLTPDISDYFAQIEAAYQTAKNTLVEGTLRLVLTIARLYIGKGLTYLDLVQEGVTGLMRAAESHREQRGAHFQHYASAWIRQAITRAIADQSRLIRLPVHMHEAIAQLVKQWEETADRLGRPPTVLEFGLAQGWLSPEDIEVLNRSSRVQELRRRTRDLWPYYMGLGENVQDGRKEVKQTIEAEVDASRESAEPDGAYTAVSHGQDSGNSNSDPDQKKRTAEVEREIWDRLTEELGHKPSFCQFAVAIGKMTPAEAHLYVSTRTEEFTTTVAAAHKSLRMTFKQIFRIQIADAGYYPLEWSVDSLGADEFGEAGLAAFPDNSYEQLHQQIATEWLGQILQKLCRGLSSRENLVIQQRFGLDGHQGKSLEEVGQELYVTRERIRQIEVKALQRLQHPLRVRTLRGMLLDDVDLSLAVWERHREKVLNELARRARWEAETKLHEARWERRMVEQLLQQRVQRGRRRLYNTFSQRGRAELFRQILTQAGEPLHYSVIHERALADLPEELGFSKSTTYATLFYHPYFHGYTKGTFGLVEWKGTVETAAGIRVFTHCPEPLLSTSGDPRSFFETVLMGQAWLQARPAMSARQFYLDMLAWANHSQQNVFEAQTAFDAWYAVGLLAPMDYTTSPDTPLQLTLPSGMRLPELRAHCLDRLCRLVPRMAELLLVLEQVARPTLATIQCILFGSEKAGYDVPARLRLLAAFDAVRKEGDVWRLGAPGKAALAAHLPQDLPDFDVQIAVDEPESVPVEVEWLEDLEHLSDTSVGLHSVLDS